MLFCDVISDVIRPNFFNFFVYWLIMFPVQYRVVWLKEAWIGNEVNVFFSSKIRFSLQWHIFWYSLHFRPMLPKIKRIVLRLSFKKIIHTKKYGNFRKIRPKCFFVTSSVTSSGRTFSNLLFIGSLFSPSNTELFDWRNLGSEMKLMSSFRQKSGFHYNAFFFDVSFISDWWYL